MNYYSNKKRYRLQQCLAYSSICHFTGPITLPLKEQWGFREVGGGRRREEEGGGRRRKEEEGGGRREEEGGGRRREEGGGGAKEGVL